MKKPHRDESRQGRQSEACGLRKAVKRKEIPAGEVTQLATELRDTPASRIRNALTIIGLGCRTGSSDSLLLTKPEEADVVRLLTEATQELESQRRVVQIAAASRPAVSGEGQDCADFLYALDNRGSLWSLDDALVIPRWRALPALPKEMPNG